MSAKIIQLQKRASYIYQNIQDKVAYNHAYQVFALADGTTQSFNSEKWAAMITERFVANPVFIPEGVIDIFTDCARKFANEPFTFSSNPAIAVLERAKKAKGASATFLGLAFFPTQGIGVHVIACGDTNLFVINDKGHIKDCFPYTTLETLNANNNFLNTTQLSEQKVDYSFFQTRDFFYYCDTYNDESKNIYIMATDALSRLFFKNNDTIKEFAKIKNFDMLYRFCMKYWDKRELEEDDISAVIINHDYINKVEYIIPPADFSFPKEKERIFTPISIINNTEQIFTDMQMQEIYNQFSGVANDFREVKRNQKFIQTLLIAAIVLSLLNLAGLAAFITFGSKEKTIQQTEQVNVKTDENVDVDSVDGNNILKSTKESNTAKSTKQQSEKMEKGKNNHPDSKEK